MVSYITAFLATLVLASLGWFFGFKYICNRKSISTCLRGVGVRLKRAKAVFEEMQRKSFHLLGLLIPFIYYAGLKLELLSQFSASAILVTGTVFLWLIELGRVVSPDFRALYNQIFGSMLRRNELEGTKKLTGTGFYFLGVSVVISLFHPLVAIAGILFLVLGDMSAALIGISFGRIKIGKKSLEGTLAMFTTCYLIGAVMFWHADFTEWVCFVGALTASLVELFVPAMVDDNFAIPVTSAIALHFALSHSQHGQLSLP